MEGSVSDDLGAPESWEVADLDATMTRLGLSSSSSSNLDSNSRRQFTESGSGLNSNSLTSSSSLDKVSDDVLNQVDQFLREALQNPRERLSILRMEQDVEKFVRNPTQQQLEFQQLPTSYLRLAAHRVAQHYSLQSMVLLDNNFPDGSNSRIIVRKTAELTLPVIRLADIPVNLPSDESVGAVKVAIKQRPQKKSQTASNSSSNLIKSNSSKSVEERKEEYNRARARIFNSNNFSGGESRILDNETKFPDGPLGVSKMEEKSVSGASGLNSGRGSADSSTGRGSVDSSTSSSRPARSRVEKDPVGRYRPNNNRVAIFRDREIDRKDPDYDRSYDRYMQRFDPGFGFNSAPYSIQPMYSPAMTYNTEFPQLGSAHRPQISTEHQPHPLPQHLPGPWAAPSTPAGLSYGHPETMMTPFSPNHVGAHSGSAIYMHSTQYPSQRPGMPFIHPHDHVHQPFSQSQVQPDATFGLARPR
ncbi:R3H domain-containing protein 1-like [Mangifera indica]|uniref:R3H domain-containing protein 1-like n=1 Tax=Mangifera indica TaxID=29780 RepID=UPI001CFBA2E1|nr:R3H domain-containing protein 1-like [Mangifera indica]XP_044460710.1 R3H domain-containing protein 1-like [Mangifera indica]